jgi:hypothetical protein
MKAAVATSVEEMTILVVEEVVDLEADDAVPFAEATFLPVLLCYCGTI